MWFSAFCSVVKFLGYQNLESCLIISYVFFWFYDSYRILNILLSNKLKKSYPKCEPQALSLSCIHTEVPSYFPDLDNRTRYCLHTWIASLLQGVSLFFLCLWAALKAYIHLDTMFVMETLLSNSFRREVVGEIKEKRW